MVHGFTPGGYANGTSQGLMVELPASHLKQHVAERDQLGNREAAVDVTAILEGYLR